MTSLQSHLKQVPLNAGYYINVADCRSKFLANYGTDALINMSTNIYGTSSPGNTLLATGGSGVFRDMGKTLVSAGRAFRKVQLMTSTNSVWPELGTDGVGGFDNAPNNYITGYLELPGQGTGSGTNAAAPVARLG
jgi:hypothetical protein